MIKVEYASPSEGEYILNVSGHAGYGDPGKDIVCAGVSALVYAAAGALERHCSSFVFRDEEDVMIHVRGGGEFEEGVFSAVCTGLEQIAESYPDNVTF